MQHKAVLREFIEALMTLANNPVALAICDLNQSEGMRIGDFMARYEGLKDGEFLGVLSSIFGLNISFGKVTCQTGISPSLHSLLENFYAIFAEPGARQDLLNYLGINEMAAPEVDYWRHRLGTLDQSELAIVTALATLDASTEATGRSLPEILAEVRKVQTDAEVTPASLARLTGKMPLMRDIDRYYLSVEPWSNFKAALQDFTVAAEA